MVVTDGARAESAVASAAPPGDGPSRSRRLADILFPPPAVAQRVTGRSVLGCLLGFAAGLTYLLVIPPGRSHLTRVWGEDGVLFLQDALRGRFVATVATSYTGYLHVLPRLSAEVIVHLPLAWWAAALAVSAAALRAAMAVLVFVATNGHLRSPLPRLLIAAAVVVLPAGNSEAINNLANLHWFTVFTAFWLLLWRPARWWQCATAMVVLALCVTTSPLGLLLIPLALVRLALPERIDRAPAMAYFVALAAQLVPLLAADRPHYPFQVVSGLEVAAARGPLVTFTGSELAEAWLPRLARFGAGFSGWPAVVALLAVLGIAAIAIVRGSPSRRAIALASLAVGGAYVLCNLYANWSPALRLGTAGSLLRVQRYSAGPCLFFATALVIGLAEVPRPRWRLPMVALRVAVAVVVATGVGYNWRSGAARLEGITWQQGMADAARQCATGARTAKIVTLPTRLAMEVECRRL